MSRVYASNMPSDESIHLSNIPSVSKAVFLSKFSIIIRLW